MRALQEVACLADYGEFTHNLKVICEGASNGQYDERMHQVRCEDPDTDGSLLVYKVLSYPKCYANVCQPADVERLFS
jgi:hypothetical protein